MKNSENKVVSIMSYNTVMEAQLYQALLESAGIQAQLQNDIAAQIYPIGGPMFSINLLVAVEDLPKAREVLGAKFDIDEFHRAANNSDVNPARKKPSVRKRAPRAAKKEVCIAEVEATPKKRAPSKPAAKSAAKK
ncbi:MAG: DUF2007 domain-containing protein [Rikenellaceae bacterium]|nr:DUF2007 domain-containing protein [Rikenellaceae bacterium]MCL2693192.1 DUF2007 domain-containing protein [Rikenellaceae bacterium]